jgi:Fe/S biogenesis protein NfuA
MFGWSRKRKNEASATTDEAKPVVAEPKPVVHMTAPARTKLLELLESKGYLESGGVRITVKNPGLGAPEYGMGLEEDVDPYGDDTVITMSGLRIVVDPQSLPQVNGATVDFVDQLLQRGFRVDAPATPAPAPAARPDLDLSDPLVASVQSVIDEKINPSIASHGGQVTLIDIKQDVVYVALGGGCQGCSMVSVTLKQGVERLIKEAVPQIKEIIDTTDHAGGTNPSFAGGKGESPYQAAAKG